MAPLASVGGGTPRCAIADALCALGAELSQAWNRPIQVSGASLILSE